MKKIHLILPAIAWAAFIFSGCKKDIYNSSIKSTTGKISTANFSNSLAANDSATVMTPFGRWRKSDIHLIGKGYSVSYAPNGHIQKIETATGKVIEDFGDGVNTQSNSNKTIKAKKLIGNTTQEIPSSTNTNWDAYATVTQYKQPVQTTSTTWIVPNPPSSYADQQAIFIFNSLQSADSLTIIQPVLQYGEGPAGGGNYWSVQNYYVHSAVGSIPIFVDTPVRVTPGTSLTGTITKSGSAGNYTYTAAFTGSQYTGNTLTINNSPYSLLWGTETLETYNVLNINDLPTDSAVRMTNISAGPSNLVTGWRLINANTMYGMHVKQVGNNEIDLYFHNPPKPAISYPTPEGYSVGTPIPSLNPTNTGGIGAYSASSLPSGLSINSATGVISGTPLVASGATNYTVTATNSTGSSSFQINITVWPAPVLIAGYGGHGGIMTFTVTPNIPSPVTGLLYWKDLTTGLSNDDAGSPYGFSYTFTAGDQYQCYFIEYGSGLPQNGKSNTVTFTVP